MSTGKEIGEMIRDLLKAGLGVTQNGHHHVLGEQSQLLYTLPATPGSQSSVRKSKMDVEKIIRGEPVRPEADHNGRNAPGRAVSAEAQAAPAGSQTEQAGTIRKEARRAQRAAEEAAEARAAERIQEKDRRKTRPQAEATAPKEWVRPGRRRQNRLGCIRLTSPDGQPAMYNTDVSRKNGREVRREDIHLEETLVLWPQAKETLKAPSCYGCYAPGAAGILFFLDARLIDRRDVYLALGRPFKKAERMAAKDHREGSLTKKNGEHVGSGAMPLCGRCYGRFAKSPPPGVDCQWALIADWPAYLTDRVLANASGGVDVRMPGDPPFSSG